VAGGVDDVDLVVVVVERGVLGEDGDAALALEVVGIHDAVGNSLIDAEGAGLAQHRIDQGGLAVVDVGDDGDVEDGAQRELRLRRCGISGVLGGDFGRGDGLRGAHWGDPVWNSGCGVLMPGRVGKMGKVENERLT